jgi:hypothetical protein
MNLDEKNVAQILKIIRTGPPVIVVSYLAETPEYLLLLGNKEE